MTEPDDNVRAIIEAIVDERIAEHPDALAAFGQAFGSDPETAEGWVSYELTQVGDASGGGESNEDEAEYDESDDDYAVVDVDLDSLIASIVESDAGELSEDEDDEEDLDLASLFAEPEPEGEPAATDAEDEDDVLSSLSNLFAEDADPAALEDLDADHFELERSDDVDLQSA